MVARVRFVRDERGGAATGYMVAFGALIAVGLVALWLLSAGGFLSKDDAGDPSLTEGTSGDDEEDLPAWLAGTGHQLTPRVNLDEREPESHLMAPWVWELIDQDWGLVVVQIGSGDGSQTLNEKQVMFLVAPDGIHFRLYSEFRNDYNLEVLTWDPDSLQAWIVRAGRPGVQPVVQFDVRENRNVPDWSGTAVPGTNSTSDGVGDVYPLGVHDDGRELWIAEDQSGLVTGVFWRIDGHTFRSSLISDEIRRQRVQGFSDSGGLDGWIDVESATAVYRGVFRVDGRIRDEVWILHDLATDDYRRVSPRLPSGADCSPYTTPRAGGQFEDGRILALCRQSGGATSVWIDPTGAEPPQ